MIEDAIPFVEKVPGKFWQVDALEKARKQRHFAVFFEQGLGKTKVGIDLSFIRWAEGVITGVLILSLKGVHRQWIREQLPVHAPLPFVGIEWPVKKLPESAAPGNSLRFLSMNIDAISASANGFNIAKQFIDLHKGRVLIIIDESQTIKNPRSRRAKEARRLGAMVSHRVIMTGTPLAKSLEEEWAQFLFLDPTIIGIQYVTHFRREYCIMGGFENREIIGHRNVARWKEKTAPYIAHFTKDQAGIEAKMRGKWHFDLTAEQLAMIKTLKKGMASAIRSGEVVSAANAAVAFTRISQVASGFVKDEAGKIHRLFDDPLRNPRMAALMEKIEATEGKIAIWARFRDDISLLMDVLGEQAVRYDGETNDKNREVAKARFLTDPSIRFFVSNPKAGGAGLNLQGGCNDAIYYSHVPGAIARWQSEDRIHRLGTVGVVNYTDLVAARSFDARTLQSYVDGATIAAMAMPDILRILEDEDWES